MNRFSRYGPPFPFYRPYNYSYPQSQIQNNINKNNNCQLDNKLDSKKEDTNKKKCVQDPKDVVWLDLFGIKLYFDDVLILSLLFFLYKEEVKDEGLFLALVMLLIS